ncbi:MAG: hypothetical protein ACLFWF_12200, partial [Alphaproteobacteria bacterium]
PPGGSPPPVSSFGGPVSASFAGRSFSGEPGSDGEAGAAEGWFAAVFFVAGLSPVVFRDAAAFPEPGLAAVFALRFVADLAAAFAAGLAAPFPEAARARPFAAVREDVRVVSGSPCGGPAVSEAVLIGTLVTDALTHRALIKH